MRNTDLKNKAVKFLLSEHHNIVVHNHHVSYSAKYIADKCGGYAGAIGHVAKEIVSDLQANGIVCSYDKSKSPAVFIIYKSVKQNA